jgi:uncharacterized protein DUF2530
MGSTPHVPPPLPPPPAPPRVLVAPELAILVGSSAWLALTATLGIARLFGDRPLDAWFWASVCGWGLGLVGYAIMRWQRSAARRGSRSAQTGLA